VKTYRIFIGSDDAGFSYKEALRKQLEADPRVSEVIDVGVDSSGHTPYPKIAIEVAENIARGAGDRGLLVCGTGIGMAIAANKVNGVRAATGHDSYSVERSVLSNNAQILTMGERVIGKELAKRLVDEWLSYEFDSASASAEKVQVISDYEERV
jgi:ribose 5-phosphate isomerase B